jgi:RNA polymerase sigma-70 factor (ECF subfamily)
MTNLAASMSPDRGATSTNLLRRVRENQADAWRRLVDLYGPLVWHWCHRSELQYQDGADVFQQVFQSVFRKIGDFRRDGGHGSFRGWLLVITQNHLRDHFRKLARHGQPTGGTDAQRRLLDLRDPDADDQTDAGGAHPVTRLLRSTLEAIRTEFDARTWQAFWRTAVDQQNSSLVAEELGTTPGAVRKAKARVLARLRTELGDLE